MITRSIAVALIGQFLIQPLHANGGGYFRGGVESTGDVAGFEPKATENIRMLDEKLTISLGQKEADVEVRYLMRNETNKKVKVRFGFPVEESFDSDLMGSPDDEKPEVPGCRAARLLPELSDHRCRKACEVEMAGRGPGNQRSSVSKASADGLSRRSPSPPTRRSRC